MDGLTGGRVFSKCRFELCSLKEENNARKVEFWALDPFLSYYY